MGELYTIGGVAEAVGRSPSSLRLLERAGVLPRPPRLGGSDRRVYDAEAVAEIRRILAARPARARHRDDEGRAS